MEPASGVAPARGSLGGLPHLPYEADGLDVVPGDVDAALRGGAPEQGRPQVDVVSLDLGTIGQDGDGTIPELLHPPVREKLARGIGDSLAGEGQAGQVRDGYPDLRSSTKE